MRACELGAVSRSNNVRLEMCKNDYETAGGQKDYECRKKKLEDSDVMTPSVSCYYQ